MNGDCKSHIHYTIFNLSIGILETFIPVFKPARTAGVLMTFVQQHDDEWSSSVHSVHTLYVFSPYPFTLFSHLFQIISHYLHFACDFFHTQYIYMTVISHFLHLSKTILHFLCNFHTPYIYFRIFHTKYT